MKVAAGGGSTCARDSDGSGRTSFAGVAVGVRGDMGGRSGDCDLDLARGRAWWGSSACVALSAGEVERVLVGEGMVNAGMLQQREQRSSLVQWSAS
jgi:hypothetical protein